MGTDFKICTDFTKGVAKTHKTLISNVRVYYADLIIKHEDVLQTSHHVKSSRRCMRLAFHLRRLFAGRHGRGEPATSHGNTPATLIDWLSVTNCSSERQQLISHHQSRKDSFGPLGILTPQTERLPHTSGWIVHPEAFKRHMPNGKKTKRDKRKIWLCILPLFIRICFMV